MKAFQTEIINKLDTIISNQTLILPWIQNMISILLGAIFGAVLSRMIQRIGRLKCYKVNYLHKYCNEDGYGNLCELPNDDKPDFIQINLTVDFHNTTQLSIGIRNVLLEIHTQNKETNNIVLNDEETKERGVFIVGMKTFETFNIDAAKVVRKKLEAKIINDGKQIFSRINKAYFVYSIKNNVKRIRVY